MNILFGRANNLAFYGNDNYSVVLDTQLDLIIASGDSSSLYTFAQWESSTDSLSEGQSRLCELALSSHEEQESITASGDRMYTIPKGVQTEAKRGLEWRKEHGRGGTKVGLNTARTLAKGGQIGIRKIRHIAKYFPRHEYYQKAEGYRPGEDGYPSNARIAWALWGGDAGQRWATAIRDREEKKEKKKKSVKASGELEYFSTSEVLGESYAPEFMARVNLDTASVDRLYKVEPNNEVTVWDDDVWDDLGLTSSAIWAFDQELDGALLSSGNFTHVSIDAESAMFIAARISANPFFSVSLDEIDESEAELTKLGMLEEDWALLDQVITAAAEAGSPTDKDGNYTPEERSDLASTQPRDANGRFVSVGSRTVIGGDPERGSGTISKINYDSGKVSVRLDSGKTVDVDPKYTQAESEVDAPMQVPSRTAPLNLDGIIAEPRTPQNYAKAQLPGTLPPLSQSDIRDLMNNWDSWVQKQRGSYKPYEDTPQNPGLGDYDRKFVKERHGINASADKSEKQNPKDADVIKYLAIVSPDDVQAVMDMVAIVPATKNTTEPVTYKRVDGKWVEDEQILADLQSPAPPPVVEIEQKEVLNDVLAQVDDLKNESLTAAAMFVRFWSASSNEIDSAITAAGGLDRNRGNAEALRRYWTRGKGALKIRWGTPGDWTRCVRQLSKYMGPRAKGYCQLRHKEVTGVYTGDKKNVGRRGSAAEFTSQIDELIIKQAELTAKAADAREKVSLTASGGSDGSKFFIPVLVPEEKESGDGRKFKKGSISMRDLPVPLLWQIKTGSGHDGSVVVGRIDYIERIEEGMGNAFGVFDTGPYGREAERLVKNGFLRGVSVDLDQFEAKEEKPEKAEENAEDGDVMGKDKLTINKARIMAATIVAKPAFQECSIELSNQGDQEESVTPEDGVYEESIEEYSAMDLEPIAASGFLTSDIPMTPPADWFKRPELTKPTPLTVDDDGRIYGHIAAWNVNHIGLPRATKPPRSRSKYAYFHTGVVRCDDGKDVPVGQLTLAGGHAPLNADAASAAKHYDDTASAVADIHVGEDEFGIWCAGSLRPDLDEMQIRALRASAPSGDWRPINGSLELVAICQVNVPGFPTARAMVAGGKMMALVAAGASYMAMIRCPGAACALADKAQGFSELAANTPDLKSRIKKAKKKARENNIEALTASAAKMREKALVAAAVAELAKISQEERMKLAEKGHALEDGAYPIRNVEDLKNAIQAYGRAKASERKMVRKHIMKRARQLGKYTLVPEHWKSAASIGAEMTVASMRQKIEALVAAPGDEDEISDEELEELREAKEEADKQTEEEIAEAERVKAGEAPERDEDGRPKYISGVNQPRDAKGKYRKVLARLKQDLGVAGLSRALKKVQEAENLDFAGDYAASAKASSELLDIVDRIDTKALNPESLENVRLSAQQLGKAISNLPLPFGKDASKLKYSDLPTGLKDLIEQMITRVEAKIGKEDADIATQSLKSYMSGADLYSQGEIQSEMSKLLRLLT